jgi:phage terminase small subunit
MSALNDRQRGFVDAMFTVGISRAAAARAAGYTGKHAVSQMTRSNRVVAAIREEAFRRYGALLPACHAAMEKILADPEHPDQLKAIKHTQAIAGVVPTHKTEVVVKMDTESLRADLAAAIDQLRAVAGPLLEHSDGA